jgi:hypothetical protein
MGHTDFASDVPPGIVDNPDEVAPFGSSFGGTVINASWAELQLTAGGALVPNNVIDQELATVQAYNATHGTNLRVKIRVSAGQVAPDWAKSIGGAPLSFQITNNKGVAEQVTAGRWWTTGYIAA